MRALFDTNAVIYLRKGLLRQPLPPGEYFISAITELELLSFHGLDDTQQGWLNLSCPRSSVGTHSVTLQRHDTRRWSGLGWVPTLERGNHQNCKPASRRMSHHC